MRRFLTYLLLSFVPANLSLFADPNNILVNGGFEYGLMCYADFVIGSSSNFYGGNYHFSLSTDAHSGQYAIELSCSTGDCTGAVMGTNYIPSPPNQSYLLSLYAKCPAGASAMAVTNLLESNSSLPLICDGTWELNQLAFQTGTSTYFNVLFYSYNVSTLLLDDVSLTYGNGDVPDQPVMFPGVRNVRISGQTVEVDGAPFLSLGFFDVPYPDLPLVAATGANTINGLPNNNAANCINSSVTPYLDRVFQLGMNFVPDSTTTAELATPAIFPTVTQTFAPHLANIVWFLADEPDQSNVPWIYIPSSTFLAESVAAKTQTSLPMMADFQKAYYGVPTDVAPYDGSVDIWMSEPYGTSFSDVNVAINNFNAVQLRPIWLAQDDIGPSLIVPKAYWAIIAGATGIHYFNWSNFKADPPSLAAAQQAFGELTGLKNAIFGEAIDVLVTAPAGIASMSRFDPAVGSAYILAANNSTQTVQGNFLVQGLASGQAVTVLYENRTITATAGRFFDIFAGVSRHVYAIQSPTTSLTATLGTKTGANASRDWQIQVYNTSIGPANSAQITNVIFTQTGGTPCTPTAAPGTYPVALGNIAPDQNVLGNVIFNFTGCDSTSKFTTKFMLAANSGSTNVTVTLNNERL